MKVQEPPLEGVGVIPAAAATADGRVLVVNAEDRLEERQVEILRRDGDMLVVADAPWGERLVAIRKPQLGPGVKARVADDDASEAAARAASPVPGFDGAAAEGLVSADPRTPRRAGLGRGGRPRDAARSRSPACWTASRRPRFRRGSWNGWRRAFPRLGGLRGAERETRRARLLRPPWHRGEPAVLALSPGSRPFRCGCGRSIYPDVVLNTVTVCVTWEGAGSEDVDSAIVELLEPALQAVDGVEELGPPSPARAAP